MTAHWLGGYWMLADVLALLALIHALNFGARGDPLRAANAGLLTQATRSASTSTGSLARSVKIPYPRIQVNGTVANVVPVIL